MARMTSSPVPPATPLLVTRKTSPSSTDTACSQEEEDQPLELTSHARPAATCIVTTSISPTISLSTAPQPQLALAGNTLRWTGHGYEICAPSSVLFSAYCDASVLMQTGT